MHVATTTHSLGFPFLSIILFLPLAGALLCSMLEDIRQIRIVASTTAILDFILAAALLAKFEITPHSASSQWVFQFADQHDWVPDLHITYLLGVDGIAVFLVALTCLMMAIAVLASNFMINDRVKLFVFFMLALESGILGVFMAGNLFLFYVAWEAMLVPMYFLMGMWGEGQRVYATMKFLIYTILGSFLMLVAIFYLYAKEQTLDMATQISGGHVTLGLIDKLHQQPLTSSEQTWLFLAFGLAFAIKLPIWPFHTWAPSAYTASPIPVVIALAGILSKAGAFGFLRYCLPLFPEAARNLAGPISVLAIVGMLYAASLALVQTDIKGLVAYSSISHMNLIALGIFALNPTGINGSVLQMINHSVIISGLFLAVAYIVARSGTRIITEMGGLGKRWPLLMWLFFVFVLAGLDLPGLSSFAGEFLILAGVFQANAWFSAVAATIVILAAWYMIRFFQDTMQGPTVASAADVASMAEDPDHTAYQYPVQRSLISVDLLRRELALFLPLILLIIYIGIQPDGLTTRINPTSAPISDVVHQTVTLSGLGGGR